MNGVTQRRSTQVAPNPTGSEGAGAMVQRRASVDPGAGYEAQTRALSPHAAVESATRGSGQSLPHLDRIGPAFGKYDVSSVSYHGGAEAVQASSALGARAFATGNHVVGGGLDVATAAHEAAHVVCQRAGHAPSDGVGAPNDRYEQLADNVGAAVASGRSAEPLLDGALAGRGDGGGGGRQAVQGFGGILKGIADLYGKKPEGDAGTKSDPASEANAAGPFLDSKKRKVPHGLTQVHAITERKRKLDKIQPRNALAYQESRSFDGGPTSHYTVTDSRFDDLYGYGAGKEFEFHEFIAHLDQRVKDAGWVEAYSWLPSGAPKAMKDDLVNRVYPAGQRWANLYTTNKKEEILWVNSEQGSTRFEYVELPRADRGYYDKLAEARKESSRWADILHTAASRANKDMKDLVLCRLMSPKAARAALATLDRHLIELMMGGMMNLVSPAGATGGSALNNALVDIAAYMARSEQPDDPSGLGDKKHSSDPGPGHYWSDEKNSCG